MTAEHLIHLIGLQPCLKGAGFFEPNLSPVSYGEQLSYNEGRIDWLNGGEYPASSILAAMAWNQEEADSDSAARAIVRGWKRTAVARRRS